MQSNNRRSPPVTGRCSSWRAGSGKTRVLTTRIAHLIQEQRVPPYRILAFTFTNKAAREMRERVERLLGSRASDCWLGTFHATGVRILRREAQRLGWERNFAIYDTGDSEAVLKELLGARALPRHVSPSEVRQCISRWKNEGVGPRGAAEVAGDAVERVMAAAYAEYEQALRRCNAFDFDDLIVKPVHLFEAEPEVLAPLGRALPLRPGRRVPGHQRHPDAFHRAARWAARQPPRRRRRRPVHLWLARSAHRQHPRLRSALPGDAGDPAGAELPLHCQHPRRRQWAHHPQPRPPRQDLVDGATGWRAAAAVAVYRRGGGRNPRRRAGANA